MCAHVSDILAAACANYHRLGVVARAGERGSRARNASLTQRTRLSVTSVSSLTHRTGPSQECFTDTSTQDVRPASDTAGHPSDHLEPHTVCFLAAGLLITKFVTARAIVCMLQQAQYFLRKVSGCLPSLPTHICGQTHYFWLLVQAASITYTRVNVSTGMLCACPHAATFSMDYVQ